MLILPKFFTLVFFIDLYMSTIYIFHKWHDTLTYLLYMHFYTYGCTVELIMKQLSLSWYCSNLQWYVILLHLYIFLNQFFWHNSDYGMFFLFNLLLHDNKPLMGRIVFCLLYYKDKIFQSVKLNFGASKSVTDKRSSLIYVYHSICHFA